MKRKALYVLATSALLLSSACSSGINDPDISISTNEVTTYSVTMPKSQAGYSIVGEKSVKQGQDYSFYVSIKEGYDASKMVVSANGNALTSSSYTYVVSNVQTDLNIEVSGIVAEPSLELSKSCYRFYLGKIKDSAKEKAYFLEGVKGSYDGASCEVDVDISKIDFSTEGTYEIVYTLVGHADIYKRAKVIVLPAPEQIDDVSIDIASIYDQQIADESLYGEANLDFTLFNGDYELTSEDVFTSQSYGGNFLSKDYLKTLSLGDYDFKISFDVEFYFSFKVSIVDLKGPNYRFSSSEDELCFTTGSLSLPDVESGQNSIQEITSAYSLGGETKSKEDIVSAINETIGDYTYTVSAIYKGAVAGTKTYSIHIRDASIPYTFSSTGSSAASKNYGSDGNVVLNFDSSDDTNVSLDKSYIQEHNTENKKYVFIAFKVLSTSGSPSMWYRDPEVCFDTNGNYVPLEKNNKYNGAHIGAPGSLTYATFALNGDTFENDVWIMRSFHGSVEIIAVSFWDLGYVDPIIEIEGTKSKLNELTSSFGNIWNYFHVAAVGKSGEPALKGNCLDVQPSFKTDMEKAGYKGAKLTLKFPSNTNIKKVECWELDTANHFSDSDGLVDENCQVTVDLPLSTFASRTADRNLWFVFNTSTTSGASHRDGTYTECNDFFLTAVSFY